MSDNLKFHYRILASDDIRHRNLSLDANNSGHHIQHSAHLTTTATITTRQKIERGKQHFIFTNYFAALLFMLIPCLLLLTCYLVISCCTNCSSNSIAQQLIMQLIPSHHHRVFSVIQFQLKK